MKENTEYIVRAAIRMPDGFLPKHVVISKRVDDLCEAHDEAAALIQEYTFVNVDIFDTEAGDTCFEWMYMDQPEWKNRNG